MLLVNAITLLSSNIKNTVQVDQICKDNTNFIKADNQNGLC